MSLVGDAGQRVSRGTLHGIFTCFLYVTFSIRVNFFIVIFFVSLQVIVVRTKKTIKCTSTNVSQDGSTDQETA